VDTRGVKVPVTFTCGAIARKDVLGVLSVPDMAKAPMCRLFFWSNHQWGHFPQDFDLDPKSFAGLGAEHKTWWILGKNGEVVNVLKTTAEQEQIPGAGLRSAEKPYGYVNAIRGIGNDLYVCGYGRQVYRRNNGAWPSISDKILTRETARGFHDIDGADDKHIYAAGWHGEIFFYNGTEWHQEKSPTSEHLNALRCVKKDAVWIAGQNGTVVHGRAGQWNLIKNEDFGNVYGIEEYNGNIYVAGNGVLGRVDGKSITKIDTGLGRPVTTHRLYAKDGQLWSIGEKDVLLFDGASWKKCDHPDND
jgi:hypothetical protein